MAAVVAPVSVNRPWDRVRCSSDPLTRSRPARAAAYTPAVAISNGDLGHLRRCVELAGEAQAAGDEPFGSLLVDANGVVRLEARNRITEGPHGGDATRHPEFEIARWAASNLSPDERAAATVYTSGEHCPMCAAAHAWVGLGRIVYAASTAQMVDWLQIWGVSASPVAPLPITTIAPGVDAAGPAPELAEEMKVMYEGTFRR
ncbi:tRNA-specific adenosine deaminase [Mycobacterium antarcticum]|nr:tRNA-specific adenosine deaminase [Mycolicibacterium sp. TUM20985]GLP84363.1 tRNA-specific adenosine deaminase [Mycolicibacterium sp. TUM20984]